MHEPLPGLTVPQYDSRANMGGIGCVFLTCFHSEFALPAALLGSSGIRLHRADTLDEADFLLTVTGSSVLLSDIVFLDGAWNDAVAMQRKFHPQVPSVVIADEADRAFVSGALNLGAFHVLWKPFQIHELRRLIQVANEASVGRKIFQCQRLESLSEAERA